MAGLERRKRRRENDFLMGKNGVKCAMDLFVPIPTSNGKNNLKLSVDPLLLRAVLERLQETGYSQIAFTHIVNGQPRDPDDRADVALPEMSDTKNLCKSHMTLLRRLHVIVEHPSDVTRIFNPPSLVQQQLLAEYDLISIAPRSDAVFQAACTCDYIDIVTLDGTTSTSNTLPYTIRSTDVRAIRNRKAVLEIPYAVPILNRNARKGLVQTCRSVVTASLGGGSDIPATTSTIPILFSSGQRSTTGSNQTTNNANTGSIAARQTDVGSIALRTPDDLVNVLQAVLFFDSKTAVNAITESAQVAIHHGVARRKKHHERHHVQRSLQDPTSIAVLGVEVEKRRKKCPTIEIVSPKRRRTTNHTTTPDPSLLHPSPTTITRTATTKVHHTFRDEDDAEDHDDDDDDFIAL